MLFVIKVCESIKVLERNVSISAPKNDVILFAESNGCKTLAWILNCGLSGVSAITCDMDIFMRHTIHYGFFTAWCQLNSWSGFKHPWWAGEELQTLFTFYDWLRYRLMPYIYSASIFGNMTGMPTCRAMPLFCDDDEVQDSVYEYMFGEDLLVGAFSDEIWLPRGCRWTDYWTGRTYEGGQLIKLEIPEDRGGALYVRGGAIIPTDLPKQFTDCKDSERIILEIYPDGYSSRDFYEDDGTSFDYENGRRAKTILSCEKKDGVITVTVGKREGGFSGMKAERFYSVNIFASEKPKKVTADGVRIPFDYDGKFVKIDMCNANTAQFIF